MNRVRVCACVCPCCTCADIFGRTGNMYIHQTRKNVGKIAFLFYILLSINFLLVSSLLVWMAFEAGRKRAAFCDLSLFFKVFYTTLTRPKGGLILISITLLKHQAQKQKKHLLRNKSKLCHSSPTILTGRHDYLARRTLIQSLLFCNHTT